MKTIGELGISATPWIADELTSVAYVRANGGHGGMVSHDLLAKEDALLISAAPELYEALRILVDMYEYCRSGCKDCKYYPCDADEERVIEKARAALAKASGEGVDA